MDSNADLFDHPSLLTWLPDETLFSLVSRLHFLSGHTTSGRTTEQFFGHSRAGSHHDIPSRLNEFESLTASALGSANELARQRTLLKYYAAFMSPLETNNAVACMSNGSVAHLKLRLGILTSRFRANHPLKACEACIESDRATHGWPYWHLEHQYPGVWVCLQHDQLLKEAAIKATGVERFQWHLPDPEQFRNWTDETLTATAAEHQAIKGLSELAVCLVSGSSLHPIETNRLHDVYRAELQHRAWLTPGGSLRMREISGSFLTHAQRLVVLPELAALPRTLNEATTQAGQILRPPRGGTHPIRHFVFIHWLFGSAEAFFASYQQTLKLQTSPCDKLKSSVLVQPTVTADARHKELLALLNNKDISIRAAAKAMQIDVGTAMAWAAKGGFQVQRRPKTLMGHSRQQLIADLQNGVDKSQAAAKAGVSVQTVTRLLLTEVGLHTRWLKAREAQARHDARSAWLNLIQSHGKLGIKFVRSLDPATYAWLYRNDRQWLDQNKLARTQQSAVTTSRVAWDVRDQALSVAVVQAALNIQKQLSHHKLRLAHLAQALPELKAKLSALDRLPLTQRAIETALKRSRRARNTDLID